MPSPRPPLVGASRGCEGASACMRVQVSPWHTTCAEVRARVSEVAVGAAQPGIGAAEAIRGGDGACDAHRHVRGARGAVGAAPAGRAAACTDRGHSTGSPSTSSSPSSSSIWGRRRGSVKREGNCVRGCVRACINARVRGCAGAWVHACLRTRVDATASRPAARASRYVYTDATLTRTHHTAPL